MASICMATGYGGTCIPLYVSRVMRARMKGKMEDLSEGLSTSGQPPSPLLCMCNCAAQGDLIKINFNRHQPKF